MAYEPTARNSWAQEIVWDEVQREFVTFWGTSIPGRLPENSGTSEREMNHRMYFTTNKGFLSFAPTSLFYDPGCNCIDATFLQTEGKLWMIIKDETKISKPAKNFRIATAASLRGPLGKLQEPITKPGLWAEGPSTIKIGEEYLIYFDTYTANRYLIMRSTDLAFWEDVTEQVEFPNEKTPERMRHGTVIAVPRTLIKRLRSAAPDAPRHP